MPAAAEIIAAEIAARRPANGGCFVVGLCGAQGSGKSTASAGVADRLRGEGLSVAVLSLDDLYLTREERERLGREVHPLLRTRGVPGTHDVALGIELLDALVAGATCALPRFDKARDTRALRDSWPLAQGPVDVLLFEGWCVGAVPQPAEALAVPVNELERADDPDGRWRRHVNDALAGDYQRLFARLDMLVLLAAPGFEVVAGWRMQQEHELRARLAANGGDAALAMSDSEIARFVQHYERLTRHILAEMPGRAQLVLELDPSRQVRTLHRNPSAP